MVFIAAAQPGHCKSAYSTKSTFESALPRTWSAIFPFASVASCKTLVVVPSVFTVAFSFCIDITIASPPKPAKIAITIPIVTLFMLKLYHEQAIFYTDDPLD